MGTVYKGYQQSIDRFVAVKVLPPHPGLDPQYIERFQLEARTIGSLQHPHILPLYDYGTHNDILYLVMAYADGGTLEDRVSDGALSINSTERLLREIAGALDYAHRRKVIHRDIKPANILLDTEGHALLADFGVVKMLTGGANLTGTAIVGTPAYMSPEQGQGAEIDGRSDVYALGAMVYQMLTGQPPYTADTPMKTILRHINDPIPNIVATNPKLPSGLTRVMKKVLAKEPSQRYQTATEFAEAFSRAIHVTAELEAVRLEMPLDPAPDPYGATAIQSAPTELRATPPAENKGISAPTIVLRDGSNPLVLLAGFGVIALAIVIGAVLIMGQLNANNTTTTTPTVNVATPNSPATALPVTPLPDWGELRFNSVNALGDALTLRVKGLRPPVEGTQYVAWLQNTTTDETLFLNTLVRDAFGDGALLYTNPDGLMLPARYNAVLITEESTIGTTPTGNVAYGGAVPPAVSATLQAIFVAAPEGLNGGSLLDGATREATFARQHSGLAANATTLGGMRVHAEHTINILLGQQEDLDGNGRGENPGRGVGVDFFLAAIDRHVQTAATAANTTLDVQQNAELIRVCTQNVRRWSERTVELERQLLTIESVEAGTAAAQESTLLMEQALNGVDANQNGQIEAFEDECGLAQIPEYGILFGNIRLQLGAPNE
jgi:serine/threonine protein kinase